MKDTKIDNSKEYNDDNNKNNNKNIITRKNNKQEEEQENITRTKAPPHVCVKHSSN